MDVDTIRMIQGVAFIVLVIFLTMVLYAYWFHLKRSEKEGYRDYEKYGNLALDDSIDDEPIEPRYPYPKRDEDAKKELEK
ncbi:cytochrome c oxidase, cbb3-type, CcoQ subunit [uncultured Campylobacter sp.]|uniref:cytochrome c oxidase, cbb3-type, CcoQ subunit n=1 Tax=uncultured Campylobacter sp. TaxID=218934 RepID=UPI00262B9300|nr:cytochrome c oxidase, cbb3-type, CcoQ subunit [uncultured Campylobacter sp.]